MIYIFGATYQLPIWYNDMLLNTVQRIGKWTDMNEGRSRREREVCWFWRERVRERYRVKSKFRLIFNSKMGEFMYFVQASSVVYSFSNGTQTFKCNWMVISIDVAMASCFWYRINQIPMNILFKISISHTDKMFIWYAAYNTIFTVIIPRNRENILNIEWLIAVQMHTDSYKHMVHMEYLIKFILHWINTRVWKCSICFSIVLPTSWVMAFSLLGDFVIIRQKSLSRWGYSPFEMCSTPRTLAQLALHYWLGPTAFKMTLRCHTRDVLRQNFHYFCDLAMKNNS